MAVLPDVQEQGADVNELLQLPSIQVAIKRINRNAELERMLLGWYLLECGWLPFGRGEGE